ncbi:MAG: hypothetical protein ACR2P1_06305, partial [Pseudomonadales bacterium]
MKGLTVKTLTLPLMVCALLVGTAQAEFLISPPSDARDAALDTVRESVDAETAANLDAAQTRIAALRQELQTLRGNTEMQNSETVDALREELRTLRQSLAQEVRDIVGGNDELRSQLQEQAQAAREQMAANRLVMGDRDVFDQVVGAANEQLAQSMAQTQEQIAAAQETIQAARDAGANRDELMSMRDD